MVRDDDELGSVRRCAACDEDWPDDEDFFSPGEDRCRACVLERVERRREQWREAQRAMRQRQRVSA